MPKELVSKKYRSEKGDGDEYVRVSIVEYTGTNYVPPTYAIISYTVGELQTVRLQASSMREFAQWILDNVPSSVK